ncbi:MAG: 3-oxoacid CoA-transferase subunit A [Bacteroidales bacterium]|nr:3-oxoacid CoA-transferase subunit A [Bacteroidales bacterium]MDD4829896.1 3-oxoacid CoA-transferase subunit A [Bacteroidales bacterium]
MKHIDVENAAELIKDGMTVMVGGFMGVGAPQDLIEAIVRKGRKNLTIICNDTSFPETGSGLLVSKGLVKKAIVSHIGTNPFAGDKMLSGEMEVELVPQGTLIERIRCGGAGLGGVLTLTGLGTVVEQNKQKVLVDGVEYLLEKPLRADVAIIGASVADKFGNLLFRGTTKNFNPYIAMAADLVIAQATEHVENIEPHNVHTPYLFIDYLIK